MMICDEQEWLARPASWGISKLPSEQRTRKQNIFDVRYYGWLAGFVECDECREWVQRTFADESIGFDVAALEEWDLQTPHPECAARPFRRAARNWQRGICGEAEVLYEFSDELCNRYHILTLVGKAKERVLALELVGPNPFRPVAFNPAWCTDTAVALARTDVRPPRVLRDANPRRRAPRRRLRQRRRADPLSRPATSSHSRVLGAGRGARVVRRVKRRS